MREGGSIRNIHIWPCLGRTRYISFFPNQVSKIIGTNFFPLLIESEQVLHIAQL